MAQLQILKLTYQRLLEKWFADVKGSIAIEFALLFPVYLGMITAIMFHFFSALQLSSLDFATYNAANELRRDTSIANNAEDFRDSVYCNFVPAIVDCDSIELGVVSADNFTAIQDWRESERAEILGQFCTGTAGDLVWLTVRYNLDGPFRRFYNAANRTDDGAMFLTSNYIVVREPTVGGLGLVCT